MEPLIDAIRTLFRQTAKVFVIMTVGIGCIYTLTRNVESVVLPFFSEDDFFYPLLLFIQNTEVTLWGIIGVALLFTIAYAVGYLFSTSARYINNDQFTDDDPFRKF
ncbi:MAG: hypothetical protein Q4B70_10175 [Lachnospiraceae bacterium]|nr:hypothetical protein [Lachnospiraceae bacterium]